MEIKELLSKGMQWGKKYRYVLAVLLVGIALMLWPEKTENENATVTPMVVEPQADQWVSAEHLEGLLSQIQGCGKVKVLLTRAAGERKILQKNEHTQYAEESSTTDVQTVIVTGTNRQEEPVLTQLCGPEYLGAVVVCQGADQPQVRLAVSDAVSKATGLGVDRISVVKMK